MLHRNRMPVLKQENIVSLVEMVGWTHLTSGVYDRGEGILYFRRMKLLELYVYAHTEKRRPSAFNRAGDIRIRTCVRSRHAGGSAPIPIIFQGPSD